uniref:Caspase family p20 domain-containing protein n=1 Tax=Knipowitschia caucasica TaxID=637954 RepID=A0AAV2J1I7_KNICA
MSHGKRGAVYGVDDDELQIDNIYEHLSTKNCPELVDKPKIIMIQACRGGIHNAVGGDIEEDTIRFLHKEKDFIALLSCTPVEL